MWPGVSFRALPWVAAPRAPRWPRPPGRRRSSPAWYCVGLLLLVAPAVLAHLPHAALSAVVIVACLALVEIREVARLFRGRRDEFWLALACFLGVVLLGSIQGVFLAVGLALLAFIGRAWWPYAAVLGRVDGLKGYHDVSRHPEARRIPGLVIFRWDAPLFFANAEIFRARVLDAVDEAPTATEWLVVAAEPVTDVDLTAADMLAELDPLGSSSPKFQCSQDRPASGERSTPSSTAPASTTPS